MAKLRILLADDHAVVREGLKALINAQADMKVVGEAGTGEEAWRLARTAEADVIVMDLSLPDLSGARVTARIKHTRPQLKVLVLTAYEDKSYMRQLFEAGATGYLLKRAAAQEITGAIRTVANGGLYVDPMLASKVVDSFLRPSATQRNPQRGQELSEREQEVLRLIAWGHSNKEIAARLNLSVKTIETYKKRLMEKLELHSRADIVRYAVRQGWLQEN
jgi:DNA-binding NarL/FixJ family response regulator